MRASHIALLSLAASTAAPVFAAPLPHLISRSRDRGAALSARDSSEGHTPESRSKIPQKLTTRDSLDDLMTTIANRQTREPDAQQEARASDSNTNAISPEEFLSAMLSNRDLNTGQDMQARSLWADLIDVGINIVSNLHLRREVAPGQLLAARNGVEDFIHSTPRYFESRSPIQELEDREDPGFNELLSALASRRDVAPDRDELAARGSLEDFVKKLNTRRNSVDDFMNNYMSKHAARELSSQQETQARGIPGAGGPTETVAQDSGATNAFIKALLSSRDSPKELTPEDVLSLASLASRALDELD
ncbi:hypothetical protein F5888DRAFT_564187 [Russula emetica]|nr:hypothetical protein F5888DRAFT_564187 [Russula emetica]